MTDQRQPEDWNHFLSPLQIALLSVNGVCIGGCLVLIALGKGSALLTFGSGGMFLAGAVGAFVAAKKLKNQKPSQQSIAEHD